MQNFESSLYLIDLALATIEKTYAGDCFIFEKSLFWKTKMFNNIFIIIPFKRKSLVIFFIFNNCSLQNFQVNITKKFDYIFYYLIKRK